MALKMRAGPGVAGVFLLLSLASCVNPTRVEAQNAIVVATCPASRSTPWTVGTQVLLTVDQNGNLCSQSTSAGSGEAVTIADGADVTQGAQADTACATDNGTCTEIALLKRAAQRLTTIISTLGTPFQAAGALGAGSAILGKVGTDTTTPGTTNSVAPITGQNGVAGGTGVDGATVQRMSLATNVPLPTGTNSIGAVTAGVGITPTDRTVTSATGASQTVMSASATRKSLTIVNTGNANCGVNPTGGTAAIGGAGTLTLAPLGSYTPRVPTLAAVTAICTAGQPLYADES